MPLPSYYYTTKSLNVSLNGIPIGPGMARADVDDAFQQLMADIKAWTDAYAVTLPMPVASGGTGATTAAAALAALGGLSSAYQRLPQVAKSGAFSLSLDMDGGHVRYTGAAAAATINPNATTAFPVGAITLLVNDGSGALTLTRGASVALVWASSGADANRVLAVGGMAALLQVATDRWFISGAGLS